MGELKSTQNFKIPILFLTFNRLEETIKVFEVIKKVKPTKLFIASDGPRNIKEKKLVHIIREKIKEQIDWECDVKTLFRDKNLGCGIAVSTAISWFFDNVEMGIILEDDCLPSLPFFKFCEAGLNYYKNNNKVYAIGGTNLLASSYGKQVFSLHGTVWGWASWRDRWENYSYNESISFKNILKYSTSISEFINALKILRTINSRAYNSWDYQWLFTRINYDGLTLLPKSNYIKNIGFDSGTHFKMGVNFQVPELSQKFYFEEKKEIKRDFLYDKLLWEFKNHRL